MTQTNRPYVKEKELSNRLNILDVKKIKAPKVHGNEDLTDDDLVEIDAGRKVVTTKRSTLTQLKGTRIGSVVQWEMGQEAAARPQCAHLLVCRPHLLSSHRGLSQ